MSTVEIEPLLLRANQGGVATLILNRPRAANPLSLTLIDALIVELAAIDEDKTVRAVVIGAEGRAFCSGHDLKELTAHRADEDGAREFFERVMKRCAMLMQLIVSLSKPVIAAVEGVATAAGCQLVAASDLAIAGEAARFATPGVNIGLFCSTPLVAIGRTIGRKAAMEMALTGALYSAGDALRFGLVNRVAPEGHALAQAQALAASIASRSATAVAIGKKTFNAQIEMSLADAYAAASRAMVENLMEADAAEGIGAFIEKREPRWRS
jgi:enoyl-CoA hydratase/carnithine racemase